MTFKEYVKENPLSLDIKELNLFNKGLTDIYGIEEYIYLEKLELKENNIEDLSPLKYLTKITDLCFGKNKVSNIEPLKYLTKLKILYFYDNNVSDIKYLKDLDLITLSFPRNIIDNINIIYNMKNLNALGCHDNPVETECESYKIYKDIHGWIKGDGLKKLKQILRRKYLISLL